MTETSARAVSAMTDPGEPGERECLRCYLLRLVDRHGCNGTRRWTIRWQDRRAAAHHGLLTELEVRGGICCDCEVLMNVWESDWEEDTEQASQLDRCAGTDARDPLILCARWDGMWLRDPRYGDDEDEYYGDEFS